ncbi:hypothetical protein INT45_013810 [Circinella minor]|uniref:Uncharacterized protein n=1 Tax=Circinella minor TaxID=1195481 RepID=A0A8H7VBQ4_9FUNG|nr:hypothetical protein INT45_013810 [Circinella minor]
MNNYSNNQLFNIISTEEGSNTIPYHQETVEFMWNDPGLFEMTSFHAYQAQQIGNSSSNLTTENIISEQNVSNVDSDNDLKLPPELIAELQLLAFQEEAHKNIIQPRKQAANKLVSYIKNNKKLKTHCNHNNRQTGLKNIFTANNLDASDIKNNTPLGRYCGQAWKNCK